jgi:heptosyltransferase III
MRILVIQTRDIGDVVLSTALCNALKAEHPDSQVDMLTMNHCAGVVEGNPNVDEIVVLDKDQRNEVGYMLRFLKGIRRRKYDVVINVQGQFIGLATCLASWGARRIGFDKWPWSLAHSETVKFRVEIEGSGYCQTIDDRFALLGPLGTVPSDRNYKIWLTDEEREHAKGLMRDAGLDLARPIVALGVNSRDAYKQWPLEHFAEVASWLIREHAAQIYVPFGPGEEEYSKQLRPLLAEELRANTFDTVRTKSIRELAAVFSNCDLYLGNDTGPRHIAQALDVPSMAVISPASDKWGWIPWDHPRFRALDPADAIGYSREEWEKVRETLTWGENDAEWFAKLDPKFVEDKLAEMVNELALFDSSVSS